MSKPLPQDVIEEILLRLPIKSIRRFMCVSKQWKSYLSDPRFAKSHLKNIDTACPENLLCITYGSLYVLTFDPAKSISSSSEGSLEDGILREIESPFDEEFGFEVGGSCNGLVLLVGRHLGDGKFLINPTTSECERVVDDSHYHRFLVYGMGYNDHEDDYKIVSLTGENEHGRGKCVDIYSFKTKTWRRVSNFGSLQDHLEYERLLYVDRYAGLFVNGCIHWLASDPTDTRRGRRFMISSFSLSREEFEEIPPPRAMELQFEENVSLIKVFRGCLAVMFIHGQIGNEMMDVWVMKEYGVRDSWTKLTFRVPQWCRSHNVVFLMNDYELVLKTYIHSFLACDSRSGAWHCLAVAGVPDSLGANYREEMGSFRGSLVSPTRLQIA